MFVADTGESAFDVRLRLPGRWAPEPFGMTITAAPAVALCASVGVCLAPRLLERRAPREVVDFDGDGDLDLAVAQAGAPAVLSVCAAGAAGIRRKGNRACARRYAEIWTETE